MKWGPKKTWICGACGKESPTREGFADVSCMLNAVLVWADSIDRTDGKVWAEVVPEKGKK